MKLRARAQPQSQSVMVSRGVAQAKVWIEAPSAATKMCARLPSASSTVGPASLTKSFSPVRWIWRIERFNANGRGPNRRRYVAPGRRTIGYLLRKDTRHCAPRI